MRTCQLENHRCGGSITVHEINSVMWWLCWFHAGWVSRGYAPTAHMRRRPHQSALRLVGGQPDGSDSFRRLDPEDQ
jgi:hypothetical protein